MTDSTGPNPFSGLPGFQPAEMLDKMWEMMRLSPFGGMGALAGATPGLPPSLSAMSDMLAPLSSVEELDKRITDLRAVEQWLKLNLGMLQSTIQAFEVQRATLATLRAFGTLAQTSMAAAEAAAEAAVASGEAEKKARADDAARAGDAKADDAKADEAAQDRAADADADAGAAFDPSGWWNLLQSQFNQLASLAVAQPGAQQAAAGTARGAGAAKPARKPATRRAAAPRQGSAAARASGASASPDAADPPRASGAAKKPSKRSS